MPEGEALSHPFELRTSFGPNHIYSLTEASNVVSQNPSAIFCIMYILDLPAGIPIDKGFDHQELAEFGNKQPISMNEKYPIMHFTGSIPVLGASIDETSPKLAYLSALPLFDIHNSDSMFLDAYYADFENNPVDNNILSDSLPIYKGSEQYKKLKEKGKIQVAMLGNSYSGNYTSLVEHLNQEG